MAFSSSGKSSSPRANFLSQLWTSSRPQKAPSLLVSLPSPRHEKQALPSRLQFLQGVAHEGKRKEQRCRKAPARKPLGKLSHIGMARVSTRGPFEPPGPQSPLEAMGYAKEFIERIARKLTVPVTSKKLGQLRWRVSTSFYGAGFPELAVESLASAVRQFLEERKLDSSGVSIDWASGVDKAIAPQKLFLHRHVEKRCLFGNVLLYTESEGGSLRKRLKCLAHGKYCPAPWAPARSAGLKRGCNAIVADVASEFKQPSKRLRSLQQMGAPQCDEDIGSKKREAKTMDDCLHLEVAGPPS